MRILIAVILLVVVGAIGVVAIGGSSLRQAMQNGRDGDATTVRVEPVDDRIVVETISAPGEVRPHTRVQISAEVSARIIELPIEEGDRVSEGDLVCRLDGTQLQATLEAARASRDGQQAQIDAERVRLTGIETRMTYATRELERMQQLFDAGDVSRRDLDNALEQVEDLETQITATGFALAQLESSLAAAEAEIQRAESGVSNTIIRAPIDGIVTALNVEAGEVVTGSFNNPGTVLMTIADLGRMVHDAEVAESDVARVQPDQVADVHVNGYPDRVFQGTVRRVAVRREINPSGSGYFRTEVELDLDGVALRSGHLANADIRIAAHDGLAVPYQAILARPVDDMPAEIRDDPLVDRTRRSALVVFRLAGETVEMVPVEAGPSDLTHRIVYQGLARGDRIVTGPFKVLETLTHGQRVSVEGDEAAGDIDPSAAIVASPESTLDTASAADPDAGSGPTDAEDAGDAASQPADDA